MWKAYLKWDQWVISKIQDAYLWLLDRTGIYLATVSFFIYAAVVMLEVVFIHSFSPWLWGVVLAFVGFSLGHKYLLQDKGLNEVINNAAMTSEGFWIRHIFDIVFINFMVLDIIALQPVRALTMIGFLLFQYSYLIKVRDRDKKPFFKPAESHDLATETGQ